MSFTLVLSDVADDQVRKQIAEPLIQYNELMAGPDHHRPLVVALKNEAGSVEGGLWGYTHFNWLFVHLLVVPEHSRHSGIGRRLMHVAEEEAARRGCHAAWLDTHGFHARGFYEKLGYVVFGELADYPKGFSRIFFTKRLGIAQDAAQLSV